ncbi:PP2C family protein-serine/threonine phosphatase [Aeromicrobium sp.]|uniref:PP2C family protein-serine/threonine phosphatase n=1 Tax=Aeromicrobium sp. TaxID=1871063 RepID=UPI0019982A6E|nr:PP2C family protein-serine/threonine phosphatase [Aeromicrobium sp.]MBC7631648.1 serine/threonine-protein phosphatase [Aeromicrobium sp.]
MKSRVRRALPTLSGYLDDRIVRWRTGTIEGQVAVLACLLFMVSVILAVSLASYTTFPAATFVIPMLLGTLALRYRPLLTLVIVVIACVAVTVTKETLEHGMTPGRISTLVVMAVVAAIVLFESSRHRSGLPGPLGEAMLVDLRDRLQAAGVVPPLPAGWTSQSAMMSAGGAKFAGDFLVANLSEDDTRLEMVLVDVCGKGVGAGTQSLQLAGALGGLIGALPPLGLFAAANDFLIRRDWDEGFATAVHVIIDLPTGGYSIINAGHPPALRWDSTTTSWEVDGARGTALGITKRPDFHQTIGVLGVGEALMFYTDGVVETRTRDFTTGIEWLRTAAAGIVSKSFDQAPRRILTLVESGDDDRAVLMLSRSATPGPAAMEPAAEQTASSAQRPKPALP